MKAMFIFKIFLAILLLFSVGCATKDASKSLAYESLQNLSKYESEIDKKISAEKNFYDQQLKVLREKFGASVDLGEDKKELEDTALYGAILSKGLWSSRLTASELMSAQHGADVPTILADYLYSEVTEVGKLIATYQEKQKILNSEFNSSLLTVGKQKNRIKLLRGYLTVLATEPSLYIRIQQTVAFSEVIETHIENLNK